MQDVLVMQVGHCACNFLSSLNKRCIVYIKQRMPAPEQAPLDRFRQSSLVAKLLKEDFI